MGIETLAHGIKESAEKEAAALLAQAKEQEHALLAEARQRVRQEKEQLRADAEATVAQARTRAAIRGRLSAIQRVQEARRQLIEQAYATALARLQESSDLASLFSIAQQQLGAVAAIAVRPADAEQAKRLCSIVRTQEMAGGLIAESSDRKTQVDLRYETLLEHLKGKTLKAVSEQLFKA